MTNPLGYVVLARRPNQPPEPVSAVLPAYPKGLEQAQNVLESCRRKPYRSLNQYVTSAAQERGESLWPVEVDPVEYVIGQITLYEGRLK